MSKNNCPDNKIVNQLVEWWPISSLIGWQFEDNDIVMFQDFKDASNIITVYTYFKADIIEQPQDTYEFHCDGQGVNRDYIINILSHGFGHSHFCVIKPIKGEVQ